ncbi:hypothetical protein FZEAL_8934 [Fusarium zealandicum]|uniref:Heterokaryon incompatibility domain-containing protein n=1 Tax=Fusarium zealandicum TaxID=1053134 RepID=A0A8H4XH65_9HYPO|nr:hypothetical protein FZEAL_8934 [Fusarium zealandicum]
MDIPWEARIARDPKFKAQSASQGIIPFARFLYDYSTAEGVKAGHQAIVQSGKEKLAGLWSSLQGSGTSQQALPSQDFVHSPLKDANGIRLLRIEEVSPTLRCSVQAYTAAEIPTYLCLSYVWADFGPMLNRGRDFRESELEVPHFSHADTAQIILNDQRFSIGANLHGALLGLRQHLDGKPIWVDAICINQNDPDEKQAQVARMGEIYSAAEKVLIWLGRRHIQRDSAMRLLRVWPEFPTNPDNASIEFHGKKYNTAKAFFDATSTGSELLSWFNLLMIVTESWWSRVWTVQEFILSKDYTFFYDGVEVPSTELKKATDWTYFVAGHCSSKVIPPWVTFQPSMFDLKKASAKLDLFDVALLGATRMAGDPRDKAWAFLGITDPSSIGQPPLQPDYKNRSMGDFYLDIAQRLVRGSGLVTLSLVNHPLPRESYTFKSKKPIGNRLLDQYKAKKRFPRQDPASGPPQEDVFDENLQPDWSGNSVGYPSWVPKMATSVAIEPTFLREMKAQGARGRSFNDPNWRIFHAASKNQGSFSLSADGRALSLHAHMLDTITATASLPLTKETELAFYNTFRSWYPKKSHLAEVPYLESTTASDALCRTLLMNMWLTTHPAPQGCKEHFANYLARISTSPSSVKRDLCLKHKPDSEEGDIFAAAMDDVGLDRALFITEKGYLGLGPARTEPGDFVSLVAGAHVPFVLRKGSHGWMLVGESYVHGVMYGEASGLSFVEVQVV